MTYTHGVERDKLATAIDRLRATYRTLAGEAEQAEARRDRAFADEKNARDAVDNLLDTRANLQDELDRLALEVSSLTQQAAILRGRLMPSLYNERFGGAA